MGKREAAIEKYLDIRIRELGGFTRKYTSPGRRGVPDRIVFCRGVYFVELKTPEGRLSLGQIAEQDRMQKQYAKVYTLASIGDVDNFIYSIV